MDATVTNPITDLMNAVVLGLFFLCALVRYWQKDPFFSLPIVLIFLTTSLLSVFGIVSHIYTGTSVAWAGALLISLGVVYSNYLFIESLWFSQGTRLIIMLFSVLCTFAFCIYNDYLYIALPFIMMYTIAALYTRSLLRIGFFMIVVSNVLWILARLIENHVLGHEIPISYRFDNDIYHFLLMFSSYIIYRGAAKGDWQKPLAT